MQLPKSSLIFAIGATLLMASIQIFVPNTSIMLLVAACSMALLGTFAAQYKRLRLNSITPLKVEQGENLVLTSVCIPLVFLPGVTALMRIYTHGGFDVAWFAQTLHTIQTTGTPFNTFSREVSHMGQHFEPILYPLAWIHSPLSSILPASVFLMISQIMVRGCILLAALLPPKASAHIDATGLRWLALLILSFWGLIAAEMFEFHPVTLGAAFCAAGILLWLSGRVRIATFLILFSTLCGELFLVSTPVILCLFFVSTQAKMRMLTAFALLGVGFACGFALLYSYISVLAPLWSGSGVTYAFLGRYPYGNGTFGSLLGHLALNPRDLVMLLTEKRKISFSFLVSFLLLSVLVCSVGFRLVGLQSRMISHQSTDSHAAKQPARTRLALLLFLAGVLALATPAGKILLSTSDTYTILEHHYLADAMPGLILIASALWLVLCSPKTHSQAWPGLSPAATACLALTASCLAAAPFPIHASRIVAYQKERRTHLPRELRQAIRALPPDRSVYANTFGMAPEASQRRFYYTEFTDPEVYKKNGLPDVLILVGEFQKADVGQTGNLGATLVEAANGDVISHYFNRRTHYRLDARHPGQMPGGVRFLKREGLP